MCSWQWGNEPKLEVYDKEAFRQGARQKLFRFFGAPLNITLYHKLETVCPAGPKFIFDSKFFTQFWKSREDQFGSFGVGFWLVESPPGA